MIPIDIAGKLIEWGAALSVLSGTMAWWRKGSEDEDNMVAASADIVLDAVTDADTVGRIDLHTGRNLRDQMTVEQAEELERERELRRMKNRN